jgi:hypothetical protein
MAEPKAVAPPAPKLLSVSLPRPVSLAGDPNAHYTANKFRIERDERGDVRIYNGRGRFLFVPKGQAILEFAE